MARQFYQLVVTREDGARGIYDLGFIEEDQVSGAILRVTIDNPTLKDKDIKEASVVILVGTADLKTGEVRPAPWTT